MADLLAGVDDLFAYLQQPVPEDQGALGQAEFYLRAASASIRAYLQYDPAFVDGEQITGTPTRTTEGLVLFLPPYPSASVSMVESWDGFNWVDVTDYMQYFPGLSFVKLVRWWPYDIEPYSGATGYWERSWRVTWSHGWEDMPDDIVAAVAMLAGTNFASPAGVQSETIGGYSVRYGSVSGGGASASVSGLPSSLEALLAPYRVPVIA